MLGLGGGGGGGGGNSFERPTYLAPTSLSKSASLSTLSTLTFQTTKLPPIEDLSKKGNTAEKPDAKKAAERNEVSFRKTPDTPKRANPEEPKLNEENERPASSHYMLVLYKNMKSDGTEGDNSESDDDKDENENDASSSPPPPTIYKQQIKSNGVVGVTKQKLNEPAPKREEAILKKEDTKRGLAGVGAFGYSTANLPSHIHTSAMTDDDEVSLDEDFCEVRSSKDKLKKKERLFAI